MGQALRKKAKKTCSKLNKTKKKKTIFQNSFLSHPKFQDLEKTKKTKEPKKTIFQNSFLSHPKFQDLEKKNKTKKNNISELFLESPQIPRPGKKNKTKKTIFQNSFSSHPKFQDLEKTKRTKKNNISELFLETPQIPRPLENCFFWFFWFSAGFCQEA